MNFVVCFLFERRTELSFSYPSKEENEENRKEVGEGGAGAGI